jgi:hypothetical protein
VAVLVPLLAANPAAALLKGPLDPNGLLLVDWAVAMVAEHPEVPVSQTPAVETAASTPLPNDGVSDNAVDAEAASPLGPMRSRCPPLGRLLILWTILLLPPSPPFSSTPSSIASLPLGQGRPPSATSSGSLVPLSQVSPPGPADLSQASWWEDVAKLAIRNFCKNFSPALAANHFQLRCFTARTLEQALEARDWPQIAACKA